jgi:FkbM family methyltransferase
MLRPLRRALDAQGIYIRRSSAFEGLDPYRDLAKLRKPAPGEVAFDVGANCGQTVLAIRGVHAGLPIHAFEPVAASLFEAQRATADLLQVTWVQAAVGAQAGQVTIHSHGVSQLASLRDTEPDEGSVANEVPLITLDAHAQAHGIEAVHLLKTDTEGFDVGVLQGAAQLLSSGRVAAVLCEVGFSATDRSHSAFTDVSQLLEAHGFVFAALYDQPGFWHLRQFGCTFGNALFVRPDACGLPVNGQSA